MSEHIHDCTGPDLTCPCGYTFTVARFQVSFDVYDNRDKRSLIDGGFGTDAIGTVADALRQAADKLERGR